MNKSNVVFAAIAVFIAIALVYGALGIFGGGNDVTVNGVTFHLPNGFDADRPLESYTSSASDYGIGGAFENSVYENKETGDIINIAVASSVSNPERINNMLIQAGFEQKTIDGKDGYFTLDPFTDDALYYYVDNDNLVMLNISKVQDKKSDDFNSYESIISEIIK